MTRVVLLARAAFKIPRTEAEMQQREQKSFSLEEENETGLSACPLRDQEGGAAPIQRRGCGGLPRAGLAPAGESEGKNYCTR